VETIVILLRFGQYAAAALLFGVPVFYALRMPVSALSVALWPRALLAGTAAFMAMAALAALVAQTAMMAGSLTEALRAEALSYVALDTGLGLAILVRAGGAALLSALFLIVRPTRGGWSLLAAVGAVVVATLAWLGHGAATEGPGRWLHLVADIVHVLAAALWLGALAAFWLMLSRRSARATDAAMFHQALKGFSGLGTLAVGLLTASGLVNTTFTVGMANLRLAPDTAYGQLLIVKLVLFGLMLVLAASNRFALTPALGRSLQTVDARMASLGRLKRSVILESVVGAALVAVVAILGIQPPPGSGF
jgi:putative copper resistance protein D